MTSCIARNLCAILSFPVTDFLFCRCACASWGVRECPAKRDQFKRDLGWAVLLFQLSGDWLQTWNGKLNERDSHYTVRRYRCSQSCDQCGRDGLGVHVTRSTSVSLHTVSWEMPQVINLEYSPKVNDIVIALMIHIHNTYSSITSCFHKFLLVLHK